MFRPKPAPIYVNARALIERFHDGEHQLVLQTRDKKHETNKVTELPGGRLKLFESLFDALKREVKEETGLTVKHIKKQETRLEISNSGKRVECIEPFAVYQTLKGPVDSMGVYFLCRAEGELLKAGDETSNIAWTSLADVSRHLETSPSSFSWIDEAALRLYLSKKVGFSS